MERLKLARTVSEKRSACLQKEFAASPDDHVARSSMHCCCEQNTLSPSFMTKQRSSLGSIHNLPRGWAMMILRGGHSFSLL